MTWVVSWSDPDLGDGSQEFDTWDEAQALVDRIDAVVGGCSVEYIGD